MRPFWPQACGHPDLECHRPRVGCILAVFVKQVRVDEFLRVHAPADVQNTVAWLLANGYKLASQVGESPFGAQLVYVLEAEVRITVDQSQWCLDVAPAPGSEAWQYDLLLAAHRGLDYGELLPGTGSRSPTGLLPKQLPEGVSWRETLPDILHWVTGGDVAELVHRTRDQRFALMWPQA